MPNQTETNDTATQPKTPGNGAQGGNRDQGGEGGTQGQEMNKDVRTWVMVALTAVFVVLYTAALLGWISASTDDKLLLRLEPILFAIIGYYFGREPSVRTENRLGAEADEERKRRNEAENAEKAQTAKTARAEQTISNTLAALGSGAPARVAETDLPATLGGDSGVDDQSARKAAAAAAAILASYRG
jgi:hypothetical protein